MDNQERLQHWIANKCAMLHCQPEQAMEILRMASELNVDPDYLVWGILKPQSTERINTEIDKATYEQVIK